MTLSSVSVMVNALCLNRLAFAPVNSTIRPEEVSGKKRLFVI
jgi:hypothetical protein